MADEQEDRVEALFHQAADLPAHEQRAMLDGACAGAPDLRAAVERLLADDVRLRGDGGAAAFLDSPVVRPSRPPTNAPAAAPPPALPAQIGHYRILRLLGEGGMGVVYEAEQDSPRRRVALKVIRAGLMSPALLKRFAHEADILGRLHHPGIAQIHEAGVAADGQPFFALEFIRGLPLDEYARLRKLATAECLDLVARVCDAVQHAHDQGIIHRDLKPGNILVDETGQPKVLDFGVARATDADLRTSADRTRTGQLVGTLSYMSPEQVAADPAALDQRSDVYTLGVILFELLAGRLPYQVEHLSLPEVARIIREQEPSRLGSIDLRLRGDVETITAKALAKEKARRYQSAADLAADIRRHLRHEPIRARPTSALYQLKKFTYRHKALVGGVAGVMAALVIGLIGTLLFAAREAQQRTQAEYNARVANDERQVSLYQAYRARLAAASVALQNHDVADAARHLQEAPEALRGWEWRHLHSRLDDSSAVLPAPAGVSFLSQGQGLHLAILGSQSVRLVDIQSRRERTVTFSDPNGGVWNISYAPDGLLLLEEIAHRVRLRDETGKVRTGIEAPAGAILTKMCLSPDLNRIAVGWNTPAGISIRVYDSSGKELARSPHSARLWALVFSPNGARLASTSDDGTARLWDASNGRPIGPPLHHPGNIKVLCAAFRPDGARLVTTSADGTVCQWDSETGAAVEPPYERHAGEVWSAVYSPDGQWIASGATDRTVRLWKATGRYEALVLHGHTGKVAQLRFTADGHRLASVSEDGTARLWEADPQAGLPVLRGHTSYVYPVAYSPNGQWIASGAWDGTVRLWDALTGEPGPVLLHPNIVWALAFSPDGSWLVSAGDADTDLRIWDVATGRLRRKIPGSGKDMRSIAVSPDGARIAATAWDQEARAHRVLEIDAATGRELFSWKGTAYAYSPDGKWLAGRAADGLTVLLWDAQTHEVSASFPGHEGEVSGVAFSSDSRYLASCSLDRTVRVWEIDGGKCRVLRGHTDEVFAVAFHPDNTRLATAGRDRAVWLWDLANGEEVARLAGHTNYVWSLAFSPDGQTLVSGSGDGTVRLWDTQPLAKRYQARRRNAARGQATD
jgi:WD40 repeat protein/predicted Ser/Thr protein kinase